MVSIESCSMSEFATKYLVEPLLRLPGRTICLWPAFPGMERVAERRVARLVEHRDRRAAQRCLFDPRGWDRPGDCVGDHLDPVLVLEQRSAGRDDLLDVGKEVVDPREAEAEGF